MSRPGSAASGGRVARGIAGVYVSRLPRTGQAGDRKQNVRSLMKPNGKSAQGGHLTEPGTVLVRMSALSVARDLPGSCRVLFMVQAPFPDARSKTNAIASKGEVDDGHD